MTTNKEVMIRPWGPVEFEELVKQGGGDDQLAARHVGLSERNHIVLLL